MRILKRGLNKYVSSNIEFNISLLFLSVLLFIVSVSFFLLDDSPYSSLALILLPLTYALGVYAYQHHVLWGSGAVGEKGVTKTLSQLDDSYFLINGVVIPPNRGDTDHIVVGPNGVFVIESKNYGGEVECVGDLWLRYKIGRGGNKYTIPVGSPSRQVKRNAKVLKDFILKHEKEIFGGKAPHIWIQSILVFTNNHIHMSLKKPTVDIMKVEALAAYIKNKPASFRLDELQAKRLGEVILKHST